MNKAEIEELKEAKRVLNEVFFPFFMRVQNICIDGNSTINAVKAEVARVRGIILEETSTPEKRFGTVVKKECGK